MTGRVRHQDAQAMAERVVGYLADACHRVEVAGSLRRGRPTVKDIEIVCAPRYRPGLFDEDGYGFDELLEAVRYRVRTRDLVWRKPDGSVSMSEPKIAERGRYYRLALADAHGGIPIDLFVVRPPAQWGAILAIRTGSAAYSKRLVCHARNMGYRCVDGRLVHVDTGSAISTPSEQDFFRACGVDWVPPSARELA